MDLGSALKETLLDLKAIRKQGGALRLQGEGLDLVISGFEGVIERDEIMEHAADEIEKLSSMLQKANKIIEKYKHEIEKSSLDKEELERLKRMERNMNEMKLITQSSSGKFISAQDKFTEFRRAARKKYN